jgi:diaminopimelate epimerase
MVDQSPQLLEFTKMSGAGNDFVVLDNRKRILLDPTEFARSVCDRRFGVGADGVLLLELSRVADFMMRYYNADGSYGGMCGNGGRCISRFAFLEQIVQKREMRFEALDHIYTAALLKDGVRLWMKAPSDFRLQKRLELLGVQVQFHFVNTGSPHCVLFLDENRLLGATVDDVGVEHLGREIRANNYFSPEGTNVTFVEEKGSSLFRTRTYERGVEAETLACGTGSVATALLANRVKSAMPPVKILVKSGESLTVDFVHKEDDLYQDVSLEGSAHVTFKGVLNYDHRNHSISDIS